MENLRQGLHVFIVSSFQIQQTDGAPVNHSNSTGPSSTSNKNE